MWKTKIVVEPPGPKGKKLLERWRASGSRPTKFDTSFCDAKGSYVKDVDGNVYLDFTADGTLSPIGHSNLKVISAIKNQLEKTGSTSHRYAIHENRVDLAERLQQISTGELVNGKVAFCNTGSDATEFCMKLARNHSGRIGLSAFIGGHHGLSIGALSLTSDRTTYKKGCRPLISEIIQLPYPYCYRCPFQQIYPECNLACFEYIQYVFDRVYDPHDIAALFMEPIQQPGGIIVPPKEYFVKIRKLCDKYGILLIDDEVATGFGRTGKMFGIEHWNIPPDMMYFAKGMASGFPIGAIIAKNEIMAGEQETPMIVPGAFAGNLLGCASALATINTIIQDKLVKNSERIGEYILKRLREMAKHYEFIGDLRGKGLLIGIEIVNNEKSKNPDFLKTQELVKKAFKRGLMLASIGTHCHVLRITPPLTITKLEVDDGLERLEKVFKEVV